MSKQNKRNQIIKPGTKPSPKASLWSRAKTGWKTNDIGAWAIFFTGVYLVFVIKITTLGNLDNELFFSIYSLTVAAYIVSRFFLSYFYEPVPQYFKRGYKPTVTFAVPSKNEEENIHETILRIARSKYPTEKFDVIAINDGSTDNTLAEMLRAKKDAWSKYGVRVEVIDWKINRGKRDGMAECVRRSNNEIVVFIDSDSFVIPSTVKELVKHFTNPDVAAVAGHAYVANADTNLITKMQSVKYFTSFKAYKAAESLFGAVTCCSGCCAAYRRADVMPILDAWLNQKFLGVQCTYGDDRSLTNFLLRGGKKAVYSPTAISYTFVPDTFKKFTKQQLRWKKSWFRENARAGLFVWKRNPIMSISFYLGFLLPLLTPIIVFRSLIWLPFTAGVFPWMYAVGLVLMALLYGLYYYIYTKDSRWFLGSLFSIACSVILAWQLPWAIINLRDSSWGTR